LARITDVVKCWQTRKNGPMIVVIPKKIRDELNLEFGTRLLVTHDSDKKIIFEILENDKN